MCSIPKRGTQVPDCGPLSLLLAVCTDVDLGDMTLVQGHCKPCGHRILLLKRPYIGKHSQGKILF